MIRTTVLAACAAAMPLGALADPLPSWNDTFAKAAIVAFVETATDPGSSGFVPEKDRLAVFDNDGTLWSEQPMYFQGLYALERLKEKAAADPSILGSDALKAAAAGDLAALAATGEAGLIELINVSHAGITVEDFQADARAWLTTAKHPTSGLAYAEMTYQPMLELLSYLRDEDFDTYIVSGGGVHFMRAVAEDAYGIPPEQVIGSEGKTRYEVVDDVPRLMKDGGVTFVDDKDGKPAGIDRHIGRRPVFVAGNSDGDLAMLEWATAGEGPRFGIIVHHTDAAREFAYDREGHIGVLAQALDEADEHGWVVVDMAKDWNRIWSGTK